MSCAGTEESVPASQDRRLAHLRVFADMDMLRVCFFVSPFLSFAARFGASSRKPKFRNTRESVITMQKRILCRKAVEYMGYYFQ